MIDKILIMKRVFFCKSSETWDWKIGMKRCIHVYKRRKQFSIRRCIVVDFLGIDL